MLLSNAAAATRAVDHVGPLLVVAPRCPLVRSRRVLRVGKKV